MLVTAGLNPAAVPISAALAALAQSGQPTDEAADGSDDALLNEVMDDGR